MKKWLSLVLSGFIITCILLGFVVYKTIKVNYYNSYYQMQDKIMTAYDAEHYFNRYFRENFEFPKDVNSVFADYDNSEREYIEFGLRDPLARPLNTLKYIPLYNSENNRREAYILLSSGIDGEIDNPVDQNDTVWINSYSTDLLLYNSQIDSSNIYSVDSIDRFRICEYFFGKKDYLFKYKNYIYEYEENSTKIDFNNIARFKSLVKRIEIFKYTIAIDSIKMEEDQRILISYENNYRILSNLYCGEKEDVIIGDTHTLIGISTSMDTINQVLEFSNCFVPN